MAHRIAGARFNAGLVHRSGNDIGRSHGKGRGSRIRGGDPPAEPHAQPPGISVFGGQFVAKGLHGGQKGQGRAVVGMAAGIGFGGKIVGHGDFGGHLGLRIR